MSSTSISDGWSCGLGLELFRWAERGLDTDVVFEVGPGRRKFQAHSLVVRHSSPVLKKTLHDTPEVNGKKVISINGEIKSFGYLLKGMYDWKGSEIEQHENDVTLLMSILRLAKSYSVTAVVAKYTESFKRSIQHRTLVRESGSIPASDSVVMHCLNGAVKMQLTDLVKVATDYLCRFWYQMVWVEKSKDWLLLSREAFHHVLIQDGLVHRSERFVYEDIVKWMKVRKCDPEGKRATELLQTVRFPLMSLKEIAQVVQDDLLDVDDIIWLQDYMAGLCSNDSFSKFSIVERHPKNLPERKSQRPLKKETVSKNK